MRIVYIEKGQEIDFRRVDRIVTERCISVWVNGGLLYVRKNEFQIFTVPIEDLIRIEG